MAIWTIVFVDYCFLKHAFGIAFAGLASIACGSAPTAVGPVIASAQPLTRLVDRFFIPESAFDICRLQKKGKLA